MALTGPRAVRAAAALEDELRRRIYRFIRDRRQPATRDEVAAAVGVSRSLAAYHLDRLVERGLLRAGYSRPPGRRGPGAGRPAKRYEPSGEQIDVSIPQRRYDLAAHLFVAAIERQAPGERARDTALRVAREWGAEVGRTFREEGELRRVSPDRTLRAAQQALEPYGFEPYRSAAGELALANCPFQTLAQEAPDLVCHVNRSFLEGVIRGLGDETLEAVLERRPADCCVTLRAP
jgi:predicted ArsR family transcriptional regulator